MEKATNFRDSHSPSHLDIEHFGYFTDNSMPELRDQEDQSYRSSRSRMQPRTLALAPEDRSRPIIDSSSRLRIQPNTHESRFSPPGNRPKPITTYSNETRSCLSSPILNPNTSSFNDYDSSTTYAQPISNLNSGQRGQIDFVPINPDRSEIIRNSYYQQSCMTDEENYEHHDSMDTRSHNQNNQNRNNNEIRPRSKSLNSIHQNHDKHDRETEQDNYNSTEQRLLGITPSHEHLRYLNQKRQSGKLNEQEELEICEYVLNKLQTKHEINRINPNEIYYDNLEFEQEETNRSRFHHGARESNGKNVINSRGEMQKETDRERRRPRERENVSCLKGSREKFLNSRTSESDSDNDKENQIDQRRGRHRSPSKKRRVGFEKPSKAYIKPNRFDGKTPWETFYSHFQNCASYNNWDKTDRLYQLRGCLEGQAAQCIMGLEMDASYEEICDELSLCWGKEGMEVQYEAQLRMRKRGKNEKLSELYQDINNLVTLAYPGARSALRNRLAVEAFISSLNDEELELRVRDRLPQDLLSCYKLASTLESNQKLVRGDDNRRRDGRRDLQTRAVSTVEDSTPTNTVENSTMEQSINLLKELQQLVNGFKNRPNERENNQNNNRGGPSRNVRPNLQTNSNNNGPPRWSGNNNGI